MKNLNNFQNFIIILLALFLISINCISKYKVYDIEKNYSTLKISSKYIGE
jgi:hypothetical protein